MPDAAGATQTAGGARGPRQLVAANRDTRRPGIAIGCRKDTPDELSPTQQDSIVAGVRRVHGPDPRLIFLPYAILAIRDPAVNAGEDVLRSRLAARALVLARRALGVHWGVHRARPARRVLGVPRGTRHGRKAHQRRGSFTGRCSSLAGRSAFIEEQATAARLTSATSAIIAAARGLCSFRVRRRQGSAFSNLCIRTHLLLTPAARRRALSSAPTVERLADET